MTILPSGTLPFKSKQPKGYSSSALAIFFRSAKAYSRCVAPECQRPAPAGHATCACGSHDLRPRVTRPAPAGRWLYAEEKREQAAVKRESRLEKSKSRLEKSLRCRHGNRTISFSISFRRVAHRLVKTKCMGAGATDKQEERSESPTRFFKAWKSELWD